MASELPSAPQKHIHSTEATASAKCQDLTASSPLVTSQADAPECSESHEVHDQNTPTSKGSTSTENRLRPAADVLNRLIWDTQFDSNDYLIGYEDRFDGRLEANLSSWKKDLTDEEFIPQHRIIYIKRKSDHEIVWDKRRRIDKIFLSGNSAFDYLAFLA